jgi:hypothetical protein
MQNETVAGIQLELADGDTPAGVEVYRVCVLDLPASRIERLINTARALRQFRAVAYIRGHRRNSFSRRGHRFREWIHDEDGQPSTSCCSTRDWPFFYVSICSPSTANCLSASGASRRARPS